MAVSQDPATRPVYAAAQRFVDEALRGDSSLFTPGVAVWAAASAHDLYLRFNANPDVSKRTFVEKLAEQLNGAPPHTIQLAAEVIYVHFLMASDIGGAVKRQLINRVLGWSSNPVAIPAELAAALDRGLAHTGVAFKTYRPNQLWFLVDFAVAWKALSAEVRQQLLDDPWAFKTFLLGVPLTSAFGQFNALLHLVHPDSFEATVSREYKEKIATAFQRDAPNETDVDRRLFTIRRALTSQYGENFNWYAPNLAEQWQRTAVSLQVAEPGTSLPEPNPIHDLFEQFLDGWIEAKAEPLKSHPIQTTMQQLRDALARGAKVEGETFRVDASVGSGNWAQVPWIAFLHRQETSSTQQGVYPVYLFRADATGVYLTLAQGVTKAIQEGGRVRARVEMATRARRVRDLLESSLPSFSFDAPVELRGATALANNYEASVIASRFYAADELPDDEELTADLDELIQGYTAFIEGRVRQRRSWIFQANPQVYRLGDAVGSLKEFTFTVRQHEGEIAVGDEVFLWEAGPTAGIVGIARVEEAPRRRPSLPADDPHGAEPLTEELRCLLRVEAAFPTARILRTELLAEQMPLRILAQPNGTNFSIAPEEADTLRERARSRVALLVGASTTADEDAVVYRDRIAQQGKAAMWWSFLLTAEKEAELRRHPFIYLYQGLPTQALLHRARIVDWRTQAGSTGVVCPWPEFAPVELRGRTSAGPSQAELFKTWFLIDRVERVEPALELADLERFDGQPMNPSGLVGGFQLWRRRTSVTAPTLGDLERATHLSHTELADLDSLVRVHDRKQIVFSGPPGSGKTFVADKFARYLTGNPLEGATDDRVITVQFHQSYGYEDFVQGIRPETDPTSGNLRYEVRPGIFKSLCDRAAADSSRTYVILIDEINRGNLSRILGELLLVLEYRDRQVQLAYSPPGAAPFSVPENVIVLGTMNTTDRSLAQIDYALRRRFYFFPLSPVDGEDAPVLRSWLNERTLTAAERAQVLQLFLALNRKVVDELDKQFQIGHSYFMSAGIEQAEVQEQVWRHAILPLLEEYFYNRPNRRELLQAFARAALLGAGSDTDS